MKALALVAVIVISSLDPNLDRRVGEIATRERLPGFAVALVTKDAVLFQKGYGWADVEQRRPFTPQSLQNVGSISKTLIGVSLMQLVEQNRIRLDDDVNRYLPFRLVNPHFPADIITIRQLAMHTSTLTDSNEYWANDYILSPLQPAHRGLATVDMLRPKNKPMPMTQFIKNLLAPDGVWYRKGSFLKKRPGTTFQYSNLGAALATYVVERVTGDAFADYTERHIFKPIGMSDSGWWSFAKADPDRYVTGYIGRKIVPRYSSVTYGDGGLITSVEDLSRYLMEMMKGYRGESTLLRQESFKEMMSPGEPKLGTGGYNIFWWLRADGSLGHSGADPGIAASMFFDPGRNVGAIVFTNSSTGDSNKDPARRQFDDVANSLLGSNPLRGTEGRGYARQPAVSAGR